MSNWEEVTKHCKEHQARLVAVSKTRSFPEIQNLYDKGQRLFGENRVQELLEKVDQLPADIEWHLIGHLQTNKVKMVLPKVTMIHSVESVRLLEEIETQASKIQKNIQVLLQLHVAQEETKFGLSRLELTALLDRYLAGNFNRVQIVGVMGMASLTQDMQQVRNEFREIKGLFDYVKNGYFINKKEFTEISMGMSGDYQIALEEGSTLVRVGSLLFQS